jgi:predicted RecA/RadA family phage recombinase
MAGQVSILDGNFVVDNSVNPQINRYTAVTITTDNTVGYGAAQQANGVVGIAQEDQIPGMPVNVRMEGITFAKAAGAISAGANVMVGDNQGRLSAYSGTTAQRVGIALTSASAANDLFLVKLTV